MKTLEALVVLEGLKVATEDNWQDITIESDARNVIRQFKKEDYYLRSATITTTILQLAESR